MTKKLFLTVAMIAGLSGLAPAQAPQTSKTPKGGLTAGQNAGEQRQVESLRAQIQRLTEQLKPSWDQMRQLHEQMEALHKKIQPLAEQRQKLIEQIRGIRRDQRKKWQEQQNLPTSDNGS